MRTPVSTPPWRKGVFARRNSSAFAKLTAGCRGIRPQAYPRRGHDHRFSGARAVRRQRHGPWPPNWTGRPSVGFYVLLGDGELQEGQIQEAAMTAAHYKLDNLIALWTATTCRSTAGFPLSWASIRWAISSGPLAGMFRKSTATTSTRFGGSGRCQGRCRQAVGNHCPDRQKARAYPLWKTKPAGTAAHPVGNKQNKPWLNWRWSSMTKIATWGGIPERPWPNWGRKTSASSSSTPISRGLPRRRTFAKEFPRRFFNIGIAEARHDRHCRRIGRSRQNTLCQHLCRVVPPAALTTKSGRRWPIPTSMSRLPPATPALRWGRRRRHPSDV